MLVLDPQSPSERFFLALARAEDAVSRLDEQVRASAVAKGWRARLDFQEASAWAWSNHQLAPLEDLVLHDAQMDVRAPEQGLTRAHGLIRARRKAQQGKLELLRPEGALWLSGRTSSAPQSQSGGVLGETRGRTVLEAAAVALDALMRTQAEGPQAALEQWTIALGALDEGTPDLVVAAFALEAWRIVNPLPRDDFVGPILAGVWLTGRRRVASHLMGLQAGMRRQGSLPSRLAEGGVAARLEFHLGVLLAAAEEGQEELRRLSLVRQLMAQQVRGRRRGSRAADLADLLLASPIVSAPMAAARLGISQQAVRALIPTLGSSVVELTGRRRFQAWRV